MGLMYCTFDEMIGRMSVWVLVTHVPFVYFNSLLPTSLPDPTENTLSLA